MLWNGQKLSQKALVARDSLHTLDVSGVLGYGHVKHCFVQTHEAEIASWVHTVHTAM